jgi:MFS family permease
MKSESFAALRYRDFRLLWFGQLVAAAGAQMRRVAIAWHIYQLTHDPIALGLISVFRVLPVLIFSLAGGLMADAHDRRKVLVVSQGALLLAAVVLTCLTWLRLDSPPIIYLMISLTGVAIAFEGPAQQSLVPNVVPRKYVANAFSLSSIFDEVAGVVAAGVAGIVIAGLGGVGTVYALNAASYLLVIATVLLMRPAPPARLAASAINLRSVLDGARYIRQSPVILGAMLMDFFATFFASANVLLPIIAADVLHAGAAGYGILSAAPSLGSIIAGAVMSFRSHVRRPGLVMLGAVAVYGAATILFGISSVFVLSFVLFAFTGAGDTVSMILRQTIRQLSTPDRLRGRMTSINMIFASGGPQLGDMEAGIAAALWGAPFAVVTGGIGCLLAVLLIAKLAPALRDYDGSMPPNADSTLPPQPLLAGD